MLPHQFFLILFPQPVHRNHGTFAVRMLVSIRDFNSHIDIGLLDMPYEHSCMRMRAVFKDNIRRCYCVWNIFSVLFVILPMPFQNVKNTFICLDNVYRIFPQWFKTCRF